MFNKRGQLTIFIIVALVIAGSILGYVIVKNYMGVSDSSSEFDSVYSNYLRCMENDVRTAADIAGSRGGYVYVDDYVPGSEYAPFSSELNFLGNPVPYWYYISGNGLIKEQVPTKKDIENQIGRFVEENIGECNFDDFYSEGYTIETGDAVARVAVYENRITVKLDSRVSVSRDGETSVKNEHNIEITSKLGKFYNEARRIYDKQKREAFLENYSVDFLRLYAPVDGVEISCSPQIWKTQDVINELKSGLENNVATLKFKGDYYTISDKKRSYFVIDHDVDESVNLIYSKIWPTKVEIFGEGVDDSLMIAEPVGNEAGLGVMGFCYVPYHYVYDLSYPVLIQLYDGDEIFQFPVIVVIDNNVPRNAILGQTEERNGVDVCEFKTQPIEVDIYDTNLNSVDGRVYFSCLDQKCRLGESEDGKFVGHAPACVNGYVEVSAENYTSAKELFSSNREDNIEIVLDREYDVELEIEVGGKTLDGTAIISFAGKKTASTALPESNIIRLSEGLYNVTVYVYSNSSISIPESSKTECRDIPKSGIAGFFGGTKEECFEIKIPETKIDYALVGGGKSEVYVLLDDLKKGKIKVMVDSLPAPQSIEDLQYNYEAFEGMGVDIIG